MPIRKVSGGFKWGNQGKVYSNRAGAARQAQAAYANGYKGDSQPTPEQHKEAFRRAISNKIR